MKKTVEGKMGFDKGLIGRKENNNNKNKNNNTTLYMSMWPSMRCMKTINPCNMNQTIGVFPHLNKRKKP